MQKIYFSKQIQSSFPAVKFQVFNLIFERFVQRILFLLRGTVNRYLFGQ
jgi:hypothetical protein